MEKFESGRNPQFSVILGLVTRIHAKHLSSVILGFIPRIHSEHSSLDSRDTPEYDRDLECIETAESGVDKVVSSCEKNPNVHKTYMNFLRQRKTALDAPLHAVSSGRLLPQCAPDATGFLSDVYKRGTRARKFLVDGVQCGRSMIEMLGVLTIIGVLSVGGIAGYSKAMETYKINKTKQQITEIITNIQTLYMQQKDFNGLDNTTAVQMGIIPDDLKTSDGEYYTSITNAFGSPVGIIGYGKSFYINFLNITKEGCIALATADWGNSASGLVAINIGFMSGKFDGFLEYYAPKGCTDLGHRDGYGFRACANHLPLSPALAAQHCDTNSVWGYDNSFGIKFSK